MSRLIDADIFEVVGTKIPEGMDAESYMAGMDYVLNKIDDAPTIEPERKSGKWIDYSNEGYVECPFCHSATNCDDNIDDLHYCFSCGAKMEVEHETDSMAVLQRP